MHKLVIAVTSVLALAAAPPPPTPTTGAPAAGTVAAPSPEDVLNWTVSDPRTVYVEDSNGQWHRVALAAPCEALRNAYGIELQGSPDRRIGHATILATGGPDCAIMSMSRVSEPPIPPPQPFAADIDPGQR
jgi:hypothetical protein